MVARVFLHKDLEFADNYIQESIDWVSHKTFTEFLNL